MRNILSGMLLFLAVSLPQVVTPERRHALSAQPRHASSPDSSRILLITDDLLLMSHFEPTTKNNNLSTLLIVTQTALRIGMIDLCTGLHSMATTISNNPDHPPAIPSRRGIATIPIYPPRLLRPAQKVDIDKRESSLILNPQSLITLPLIRNEHRVPTERAVMLPSGSPVPTPALPEKGLGTKGDQGCDATDRVQ
ncbi:MAG: hypothetical protein K9L28_03055 [Synergistales bacterium]|nr:hypothetical protein [Synergistales bacterium]